MKIILTTVFVAFTGLTGLWAWFGGQTVKNGPVTVVSRQIDKVTGRISAVRVRLQKANGDWKVVERHLDESGNITDEHVRYAIDGRGLFFVDEENKVLQLRAERPAGAKPVFNEEAFKAHPDFLGEKEIAGVRVLGMRTGPAEQWVAPEYNGLLLRIEDPVFVLEAVSVTPGLMEPFGAVPDYPVDKQSSMKKHIEGLEQGGNHEQAEGARKAAQ